MAKKLWRCAVCRKTDEAGTGAWACHVDLDTTPVHRGECWRKYFSQKVRIALAIVRDPCSPPWMRKLDTPTEG